MKSSIFERTWLVYKISDRFLEYAAKTYAKGRMLDIGCWIKPYREMFKPYIKEHIGVDNERTIATDIVADTEFLPIKHGTFDAILSTAVLEHIREPDKVIEEMNRILKRDAFSISVVPLFWNVHNVPGDFYRYTKFGLKYLFEKNGFEIVYIKAMSGFWITWGQMFLNYIWRFSGRFIVRGFIKICSAVVNLITYSINKIPSNRIQQSDAFTWAYIIVAKKK